MTEPACDNRAVAEKLAAAGLPIFPCGWEGGTVKRPLIREWQNSAAPDAAPWRTQPFALVGLPVPPGVVVVDSDNKIDAKSGEVSSGENTLREAALIELADAASLIVQTASGGLHRWFHVDNPDAFSNTSHVNGLPCIDLRTAGKGYVIAPGCAYERGEYRIIKGALDDLSSLTRMPAKLASALRKPKPSLSEIAMAKILAGGDPAGWISDRGQGRLSVRGRMRLEKRLEGLFRHHVAQVEIAPKGSRHNTLIRYGRTLAGYLHYRAFTANALAAALYQASIANGRISDDGGAVVQAAIRAAITDGAQHPLALEDRHASGLLMAPPFKIVGESAA